MFMMAYTSPSTVCDTLVCPRSEQGPSSLNAPLKDAHILKKVS